MGGPSVSRLNPASQPSLTQPGLDLLGSIFGGSGAGPSAQQRTGAGGKFGSLMNMPSPLSGARGGAGAGSLFGNLGSVFGSPVPSGAMNTLNQLASGPNPGQSLVNAYQPIFQRNLALAQDQGPRFSSGNELLRTQSMNDFNMFAQQALQQGQQRQLEAAMGAGQLGISSQLPLMQQLLSALFQGGGINSGPIYNMQPGLGQQLLGLGGALGGAALGGGLFGGAGGGFSSVPTFQEMLSAVPSQYGGTGR